MSMSLYVCECGVSKCVCTSVCVFICMCECAGVSMGICVCECVSVCVGQRRTSDAMHLHHSLLYSPVTGSITELGT